MSVESNVVSFLAESYAYHEEGENLYVKENNDFRYKMSLFSLYHICYVQRVCYGTDIYDVRRKIRLDNVEKNGN